MKISVREMVLVALFAALTAVGAFLKFPLPGGIDFTFQVFFVFLAGLLLGGRLGFLSQVVYLALGLAGLPIFTKGGGLGYLMQPSFGYLIGFVLAALVIGKLTERGRLTFAKAVASSLLGLAIVYLVGVPYLFIVVNYLIGKSLPFSAALKGGCLIFLPWDLLKIFLVSFIAPRIKAQIIYSRQV